MPIESKKAMISYLREHQDDHRLDDTICQEIANMLDLDINEVDYKELKCLKNAIQNALLDDYSAEMQSYDD